MSRQRMALNDLIVAEQTAHFIIRAAGLEVQRDDVSLDEAKRIMGTRGFKALVATLVWRGSGEKVKLECLM